jgi:hypothetical protein
MLQLHYSARRYARLVIGAFAATGAACNRELSVAQRQQWHADSLRYQADLAAWTHDSVVIDSIVRSAIRTANADSMWTLHRSMLRSPTPADFPQLIECESIRLRTLFGLRVAQEIKRRAKQEVFGTAPDSEVNQMNQRLPRMLGVETYGDVCGRDRGHPPSEVDGVSMEEPLKRPLPPPRPR